MTTQKPSGAMAANKLLESAREVLRDATNRYRLAFCNRLELKLRRRTFIDHGWPWGDHPQYIESVWFRELSDDVERAEQAMLDAEAAVDVLTRALERERTEG